MKNILYFIPSLSTSGGMERVLTEKVNYLANTGYYQIFIVTTEMSDCAIPFFDLNSAVNVINLKLYFNDKFNLNIFDKTVETRKLLKKYKEELKAIVLIKEIDICVSMGGKELEFLGTLNLQCKTIYESHFNKNFRSSFLKAQGKLNLFWNLFGMLRDLQHNMQAKKIDKIVVLTKENYSQWMKIVQNVELIHNPSPLINIEKRVPDFNAKRVISIGKLDPQKGFDMLIEAWEIVFRKYPEWQLHIFGEGYLTPLLEQKIKALKLDSVVKLAGLTRNVQDELFSSSFYVLSSRFEGLPMVLIESITCGLPIVAFDCETGPREIIQDNDCGILVENGNIEKLAFNIERMILDTDLRKEMSINALEKSKKYELTYIMGKWEKIFQDLVT